MQKTRLSLALHQIFNPDGHQLATGVLVDDQQRLIPLTAWVTVTYDGLRRGRKKNLGRAAAVFLAAAWHQARGLPAGKSDKAIAELLKYSDERAVRRVRRSKAKEIKGYYLLAFIPNAQGKAENTGVFLMDKSTEFEIFPDKMTFSGAGWRWNYSDPEASYQPRWKAVGSIDPPLTDEQVERMRQFFMGDINSNQLISGT